MSNIKTDILETSDLDLPSGDIHQPKAKKNREPSLSQRNLLAYGAPACATFFLLNPTWSILPGIYVRYFHLSLTAVAAVLLYARLFDAVSDPVIGYLADRHRLAGGTRKIWVMTGGIGLVFAAYFLFLPPDDVTWTYYLFWSFCFYLAWTVIDIPHGAWGGELTADYNGRARAYGYRVGSLYVGQIAFFALPLLPVFGTGEYTPDTLRVAIIIGVGLMLLTLTWMWRAAPSGRILPARRHDSFRLIVQTIVKNQPLLHLLLTLFMFTLSGGMWSGLVFIYLDAYLDLGEKIAPIFLLGNIAGLLFIPVCMKFIQATNKATAWGVSITAYALLLMGGLLIHPGMSWIWSLLLVGGAYISFVSFNVASAAMMADVADYGLFKFHQDRRTTYYAIGGFTYKAVMGLGAGISLGIAGYFGFDAEGGEQTHTAIWGMRLGFLILPAVLALLAVLLLCANPITRSRHHIITNQLNRRAHRSASIELCSASRERT